MPRLRYEGPGHRLAAFGKIVRRGDEATFTDDEAATLLSQRYVRFSIDGQLQTPPALARARNEAATRPSVHGSRRQWAGYAEGRGVAVNDEMTRDDIVAAVDAPPPGAGEPEAHQGEGHTIIDEQES